MKPLACLLALTLLCHAEDAAVEKVSMRGKVLQVLDDGLLVECKAVFYTNNWDQSDGDDFKPVKGIVFLKGHADQKKLADGDRVGVIASAAGNFKYTNALGVVNTVHAFQFVKDATNHAAKPF